MSQVTWDRLSKDPAVLHLVAGAVPPAQARLRDERKRDAYREELVGRLVAVLKPKGKWAMTALANEEISEVYVAFGRRSDAERFAAVVDAKGTGRYEDGWASQRRFVFDRAAEARFAEIVGSD
jgi:hypothetical protein